MTLAWTRYIFSGNRLIRLIVLALAVLLLISSLVWTQRMTEGYSISLAEMSPKNPGTIGRPASPTQLALSATSSNTRPIATHSPITPWGALKDFRPSREACKKQQEIYDSKLAAYAAENKLQFDNDGEIQDESWVMAKSQTLFDDSCWLYSEREEPYAGADTNGQLNKCNALEPNPNRKALVLRLAPDHLFTPDAVHMTRQLFVEIGWRFRMDIILLENVQPGSDNIVRSNVPEEFKESVISYNSDMIFANYTEAKEKERRINYDFHQQKGHYTQRYFQFVQAWFFEQQPQYEFAYFLESHVRASTDWGTIFKHIFEALQGQKEPDLISLSPIRVTAPTSWDTVGPRTMPEHCCSSNLAVHGVSRRLGLALRTHLDEPNNAIFNAFLPATAIKNNFNIFMFAHPLIKPSNDLMFEQYMPPTKLQFTILNLRQQNPSGGALAWQTSFGSFEETKRSWMDNIYQNWRSNQTRCLPGLLIFPVSGR